MKPRVLASVLICSVTLMATAAPAVAATLPDEPTTQQMVKKAPHAPYANIAFTGSQPVDSTGQLTTITPIGQPKIQTDPSISGPVAVFDGRSAYQIPLAENQYEALKDGMSISAFFKVAPDANLSGEHDLFSNQQSGGLGLGTLNGRLTFFAHVGGQYRQPQAAFKTGKWVHAVGVIDKANGLIKLYVNGQLVDSVAGSGDLKFPQNSASRHFVLGGDSSSNGAESFIKGQMQSAQLYDHVLSDAEIEGLSQQSHSMVQQSAETVRQPFETRLIGANSVVTGHTYNLNVHTRELAPGDIDRLSYDVTYDPTHFTYVGANQKLPGTTVTDLGNGRLKVTTSQLSEAPIQTYSQTRLAVIQLRAKSTTTVKSTISVADANATSEGQPVARPTMTTAKQSVQIYGQQPHDFNGDGIIGAGDVALAPADQKAAVARQAKIQPYKHVIVLTTDGGGNPWDPRGIYYAKDANTTPTWTTDPALMAKRRNSYTMRLFNQEFAMSTSAHSVIPAISAQNYVSMLHGLPWASLPKDYQTTNTIAGQTYFNDFGLAQAKYPSVFKVLQSTNPYRSSAAFAEWAPILNGIIEPDAAVTAAPSASLKSFDDVANYIGTPAFNNTAVTYMQSDYMDHQGHSNGWYNDNYWNEYAKYDQLFKTVMDQLKTTGHLHDTLVIANADHGGKFRNHGQDTSEVNTNIFMALGGDTVDSGRRLTGGSNADVSLLILDALKVPQPASMTGQVFDKTAFLPQTELAQKHRELGSIDLTSTPTQAALTLAPKDGLGAVDLRIDLANRKLGQIILPDGVTKVRQTVSGPTLSLTLAVHHRPTKPVVLQFQSGKEVVKLTSAMFGTTAGKEVLPDITNNTTDHDLVVPGQSGGHDQTNHPETPTMPGRTPVPAPIRPKTHGSATRPFKIYVKKTLGFYKTSHLVKTSRYRWFKQASQRHWPKFTVLGRVTTTQGLRYRVRDENPASKTYHRIGYITARKGFTTPIMYHHNIKRVQVINASGVNGYRQNTMTGRQVHYQHHQMLKIKRLVRVNHKYRYQLTNGQYITADKHFIRHLQ